VSRIHLLKRMTEEEREIHVLYASFQHSCSLRHVLVIDATHAM